MANLCDYGCMYIRNRMRIQRMHLIKNVFVVLWITYSHINIFTQLLQMILTLYLGYTFTYFLMTKGYINCPRLGFQKN